MAFELVEVKGIRQVKGKDGRVHHFLNLSVQVSATIYMDQNAISLAGLYERFIDKPCLLEAVWVEREGRTVLQLTDNSFPVEVPPQLLKRRPAPSRDAGDKDLVIDESTGEILNSTSSPLDFSKLDTSSSPKHKSPVIS